MTPDLETDQEIDLETSENPIDRAAADWAARVDGGAMTDAQANGLAAWLAADVRHQGAFARAQAAFAYLDRARALGAHFTGETFNPDQAGGACIPEGVASPLAVEQKPSRRAMLRGGAAVAAGLAAAMVFGPDLYDRLFPAAPPELYASKKGEIKLVSLTDASVLTLNTHSHVAVDYTRDRRSVNLREGEVMFAVAKDHERPFSVLVGELEVRAVGTSFMVRNVPGRPAEVLVQEGVVDVVYRSRPASLVRAPANTRVTADDAGVGLGARLIKAAVSPATVARETAWRQGMIAFEGVSLATAAAEFSRYSDTRIVIDDAAIARTTITGLFEANNPEGFSYAVAGSLGLKVEIGPGYVRLHNRAQ